MNRRLCQKLWNAYPGQWERIGHMAILAYDQVHMANLCVSACSTVNGVSQIHADILRKQTFKDYYALAPERFLGITNGITHRRCKQHTSGQHENFHTDPLPKRGLSAKPVSYLYYKRKHLWVRFAFFAGD